MALLADLGQRLEVLQEGREAFRGKDVAQDVQGILQRVMDGGHRVGTLVRQ